MACFQRILRNGQQKLIQQPRVVVEPIPYDVDSEFIALCLDRTFADGNGFRAPITIDYSEMEATIKRLRTEIEEEEMQEKERKDAQLLQSRRGSVQFQDTPAVFETEILAAASFNKPKIREKKKSKLKRELSERRLSKHSVIERDQKSFRRKTRKVVTGKSEIFDTVADIHAEASTSAEFKLSNEAMDVKAGNSNINRSTKLVIKRLKLKSAIQPKTLIPNLPEDRSPIESTPDGKIDSIQAIAVEVNGQKQLKQVQATQAVVDKTRLEMRKSFRDVFILRARDADDILLTNDEIRSISLDLESNIFQAQGEVSSGSAYKQQCRNLLSNLRNPTNRGLFRRLLNGNLSYKRAALLSSQEMASKQYSEWTGAGGISTSHASKLATSTINKKQGRPIGLLAGDTTGQHKSHLFDLNCNICTGKQKDESTPKKFLKKDSTKRHPIVSTLSMRRGLGEKLVKRDDGKLDIMIPVPKIRQSDPLNLDYSLPGLVQTMSDSMGSLISKNSKSGQSQMSRLLETDQNRLAMLTGMPQHEINRLSDQISHMAGSTRV